MDYDHDRSTASRPACSVSGEKEQANRPVPQPFITTVYHVTVSTTSQSSTCVQQVCSTICCHRLPAGFHKPKSHKSQLRGAHLGPQKNIEESGVCSNYDCCLILFLPPFLLAGCCCAFATRSPKRMFTLVLFWVEGTSLMPSDLSGRRLLEWQ